MKIYACEIMDVKYILVAIIIILFIVNIIALFYLNSQIATLSDSYNTVVATYNTLKSYYQSLSNNYSTLYSTYSNLVNSYNTLSTEYATLKAEYNNLSAKYNELSQNYTSLSNQLSYTAGIMTIQSFYINLAQVNTQGIQNLLIGPMSSYFQITSPPGKGTVIISPSNTSSAIPLVGAKLSQFFGYLSVKTELKELIVTSFQSYVLGEGLVSLNDQYGNGTIVTTYALVTVVAQKLNLTNWQVVYLKIDNSINQAQYTTLVTLFNTINALESKNIGQLQSALIGPFPSYVYIAQGPFAGNYTGLNVLNQFIDMILSKNIASFQFGLYYFNITPISSVSSEVNMYGVLTITLTNGSTYTYYANLNAIAELQPNGVPQVIGLNILNNLTQEQIISVIPK